MRQLFRQPWLGPLLAVVAVYVLFALLAPDTFTRSVNVLTMARQTVVVSIAAVGMTLVMIQGGIDLSVGSTVALTTVIVARMLDGGSGAWTAAAGGVALGACVGAINGLLVSGLGLLPFIVTLGSMSALRGVAKGLANEQKVDADPKGLESLMSLPRPTTADSLRSMRTIFHT